MTKLKFLSVLVCMGLVTSSAFAGTDAAAFLKKGVQVQFIGTLPDLQKGNSMLLRLWGLPEVVTNIQV